jgi:hypothetical protein
MPIISPSYLGLLEMMTNRLSTFAVFAMLGGCSMQNPPSEIIAVDIAYNREMTPGNVVITVSNKIKDYVCISRSDMTLAYGKLRLLPESATNMGGNRPPSQSIGEIVIDDGLYVIPPEKSKDVYVEFAADAGEPTPKEIVGSITAARCSDIFRKNEPRFSKVNVRKALF